MRNVSYAEWRKKLTDEKRDIQMRIIALRGHMSRLSIEGSQKKREEKEAGRRPFCITQRCKCSEPGWVVDVTENDELVFTCEECQTVWDKIKVEIQ